MRVLTSLFLLMWAPQAWSYMSVMDTGEVLDAGQYRVILEPQLLFHKQDGGNVVGRFDAGLTESFNVRALLGSGIIDFQTGVFLKYVPIPDYGNQPAIGLTGGVVYARYEGEPETSIRINPLISKRIESRIGVWTPYGALPMGLAARKGKSDVPIHAAIGTQFQSLEWKNLQFMGEIGANINNSYSYISLGAIFYFDENNGFSLN